MRSDSEVIAANLRAFRAAARLKQVEVAEAIGVHHQTYRNFERGAPAPYLIVSRTLALYGIEFGDLITSPNGNGSGTSRGGNTSK
jgi:DNA-binding XRE family transcriptional regulator